MTVIMVIMTKTMMQIKVFHIDGINGALNDVDCSFGA